MITYRIRPCRGRLKVELFDGERRLGSLEAEEVARPTLGRLIILATGHPEVRAMFAVARDDLEENHGYA